MLDLEILYDHALNINTVIEAGESPNNRDIFFGYIPTSYYFLENIFKVLPFEHTDHLVDFGCGKGRVLFMAALHGCKRITGCEINEERCRVLKQNIVSFKCCVGDNAVFEVYNEDVQNAVIPNSANKFYFFNPFHYKVYIKVIKNILTSLSHNERAMSIYLYHPHESVLSYLDKLDCFKKEICIEHVFSSARIQKVSLPRFVIYSNYPINHSLDEYSLTF